MDFALDLAVRSAAMAHVERLATRFGRDPIPRRILHHAAVDSDIIGISPARIVEVRRDILDEEDGPMLLHGLQGVHRQPIALPRQQADHPAPEYLDIRYQEFRRAG